MFYCKKFIFKGFLLVLMCDFVGGIYYEFREKLKFFMFIIIILEKFK